MSELEISDYPGTLTLRRVQWQCERHGKHDRVLTFVGGPEGSRTVCIMCLLDALDRLGVHDLPRVD